MKTVLNAHFFLVWCFLTVPLALPARSPFRTKQSWVPEVTLRFEHDTQVYTVSHSRLQKYPLFGFHVDDLKPDLLPDTSIEFAHDATQAIPGDVLKKLIAEVVDELYAKKKKVKKKKLERFIILQDKNFSYKRTCGLLVLKFKEYPFVLKLFIEYPKTLLNPYLTGLEPTFFYFMGGGVTRHLSGLTRIKNLKRIREQVAQLEQWRDHVLTPRKWFWLPEQPRNIVVRGKNIGAGPDTIETILPGIYGIVADAIPIDEEIAIPLKKKKKMVMKLCNDLDMYADPHFVNFIFLEDLEHKKFNIVIIDTEHFPTMVGLKEPITFSSHRSWYLYLARKCVNDMFFQTKEDIIAAQTAPRKLMLDDPIVLRPTN